jgi:GNAT superfamily N-acetyltransferase
MTELTIYYLDMLEVPVFQPRNPSLPSYNLVECKGVQPEFNAFLYSLVGKQWDWTDRLAWEREKWDELVSSPNLRTWVAYCDGIIAGYFELRKEGGDVEILYFGLSPEFIGKGLGRLLLEDAISHAWSWSDVTRVWLHTCDLDHPAALKNYERRGFKLYKTEKEPLNA